jgi:hypothetical protein
VFDLLRKPTDIDRLYGLELACPYCAEPILVRLDLSAGSNR